MTPKQEAFEPDPDVMRAICDRLAAGESLRAICRTSGMPSAPTVCRWVTTIPEFAEQYARARDIGLDLLADEIVEIADTPEIGTKTKTDDEGKTEVTEGDMIEHRRLRVDARKWYLSKLAPKRYGDKLELAGDTSAPLVVKLVTITSEQEQAKAWQKPE